MNMEMMEAEMIDHRVQLARLDERLNNLPTRKELYAVAAIQVITTLVVMVGAMIGVMQVLLQAIK